MMHHGNMCCSVPCTRCWEAERILAYMAFCEVSQDQSPGTPAAAGDFGFKVLTASDPAEKTKKLSAELANGRLAMMAIIGMFFQEAIDTETCQQLFACDVFMCIYMLCDPLYRDWNGLQAVDCTLDVHPYTEHTNKQTIQHAYMNSDIHTAHMLKKQASLQHIHCSDTTHNAHIQT